MRIRPYSASSTPQLIGGPVNSTFMNKRYQPAIVTDGTRRLPTGATTATWSPNGSKEPALAMDANLPAVLAAGANDLIDSVPCQGSSCDLTPDIGISGVYFSFDSGATWTQPACTGPTAQNGTTRVGPIHTLPGYLEHGMSKVGLQ
jgi:hypothetical protein